MLEKGVFTISIDHELAWGYADRPLGERERARIRGEYDIARRLLDLFERYRMPATWAVVGHLLERACAWKNGTPHPEYPRPLHTRGKRDWFFQHPPEGEHSDPLWYDAENLVERITRSNVGHEVASHSYAHIIYGARDVSEAAVRADLTNVARVHKARGIPATSFVFPRNRERYHGVLREYGFTCFRGTTPCWYDSLPGLARRGGHYLDYLLPTVRTVLPTRHASGLVNVPDSVLLFARGGLRTLLPTRALIWKAKRHLRTAAQKKRIFHLWFHPSNFSHATETQFGILERILEYAAAMRDEGVLEVRTMRGVCSEVT